MRATLAAAAAPGLVASVRDAVATPAGPRP
jgi:hypothetical protein